MNPPNPSGFSFGQLSSQGQNGTTTGTGFFGSSAQPTATATVNPLTSSSGFSFGNSTQGGFSFGQPAPATTSSSGGGFSFLQPSSATSTPGGGFSFGQNTAAPSGGLNFGQTAPATSSFGQTAPATSSFGQIAPATSSFGQTAPATSSFGQTAPATSSGFSFGQTNPTTTASTSFSGFSFGQSNPVTSVAPLSGFSLGQSTPATSSSGLNFGLNTGNVSSGGLGQPVSSGFSFMQPSNASSTNATPAGLFGQSTIITPSSSTGLFGQTATNLNPVTASTSLFNQTSTIPTTPSLFGQTSTIPTTPSLFGQTSTIPTTSSLFGQTSSIPTTSSLFGQPSTIPTTSSLFGQTSTVPTTTTSLFSQSTSTTPSGLFGQTSSSSTQPSSGLNFGLGSGGLFGQTSNASTSTGLTFGTPAPSSGFNFASSSPASTSGFSLPSSSGGLGGTAPASSIFSNTVTSTPSLGLGGSLPTSSTISTAAGLGGFQTSSIDSGNSLTKGDGKSAKETPLPQDIFATIAVFQTYKDLEKKCSEDNIRQTATPFHKLVEDTRKLRQHIVKLSNQNNRLHSSAQKLKSAVIQEAENVEMARRTQDTPMNLQGDNKAPEQFFLRLVRSFEERMTFCRNRIEEVERCARSNGNCDEITSDDMKEVLKKEHEMVKALAAKIYALHNQLINYTNQSNNLEMQPEVLFKPSSPDQQETVGFSGKNTTILRPALGEGGSGLLNFQSGQQKAKALSLGAAPPTLPLSQSAFNPLGSSVPLGSSPFNFNSSSTSNNNNTLGSSFNFNNGTTFENTASSTLFGSPSANLNQSVGIFGAGSNTSLFGNAKNLKKSHESDDYQRKRRM